MKTRCFFVAREFLHVLGIVVPTLFGVVCFLVLGCRSLGLQYNIDRGLNEDAEVVMNSALGSLSSILLFPGRAFSSYWIVSSQKD